jgi:hypothetical protein
VRDIEASVEVRALIGADKLRELHEDAFARYECWQCGKTGRTTEPTSVIVLGYWFSGWSSLPMLAAPIRTSSRPAPPRRGR